MCNNDTQQDNEKPPGQTIRQVQLQESTLNARNTVRYRWPRSFKVVRFKDIPKSDALFFMFQARLE